MSDQMEFELELRMDATIAVKSGGELTNWIKPGVSTKVKFFYMPEDEEIAIATEHMTRNVLDPTMDDIIQMCAARVREING